MRYKEFKEKVEAWGRRYDYKPVIEADFHRVYITLEEDDYSGDVCTIHNSERFVIDLNFESYRDFSENEKNDLFKIVTEFSATKPEDREDEKLFYVKHKFLSLKYDLNYLNRYDDRSHSLDNKFSSGLYKTKFTLDEIEGIKKEFNTTLEDFELIEVGEVKKS